MWFRRSFLCVLCFVLLLIVVGCDSSSSGSPVIETVFWEPDGNGVYRFSTNDSQYYQSGFWNSVNKDMAVQNADTFEVVVKKESGASTYGYGMVFDYVDGENFGVIFITLNGSYSIRRQQNDEWTKLTDPNNDGYLPSGGAVNASAGAENRIEVTLNRASDTLSLNINGTNIYTYFPYSDLGGSGLGAYASSGSESEENFPTEPVDVRYRTVTPVALP